MTKTSLLVHSYITNESRKNIFGNIASVSVLQNIISGFEEKLYNFSINLRNVIMTNKSCRPKPLPIFKWHINTYK